jgi:septal ring factor EnvC (AmiA/AmiB activator)
MLRAFCVCVFFFFGAGQLSEEVRAKEKRETQVLEELAGLRDSLRAEEQARFEVSEERERLTKQLGDLDAALQVLNLHLPKLSGSNCVFVS